VNEAITRPIILVVDDAPALRFLCRVNLELEGYEVVEAGTLDEARELIDLLPVALVLLDLQIGAERSEPLLFALRASEPRIPVVVVTGSAEIDSGELDIDADAVLAKPFTIDELLVTVRSLTGHAPVAG
jgi:DNA-binding response OmpR family regulator